MINDLSALLKAINAWYSFSYDLYALARACRKSASFDLVESFVAQTTRHRLYRMAPLNGRRNTRGGALRCRYTYTMDHPVWKYNRASVLNLIRESREVTRRKLFSLRSLRSLRGIRDLRVSEVDVSHLGQLPPRGPPKTTTPFNPFAPVELARARASCPFSPRTRVSLPGREILSQTFHLTGERRNFIKE